MDDEPPIPFEPSDTDDGTAGSSECLTAAQQVQSTCELPEQFFFTLGEGVSMISIDDPAASIPIGPHGWLVQAPSGSHFIGSQYYDDGHCSAGCGWCQPGQSLCHSGFDDDGLPGCMLCMPWDSPDPEAQCAQLIGACAGAGNGGDDEPGDPGPDEPPDEPVPDETSSGDTGSEDGAGGMGSESGSGSSTGFGDTGDEPGLDETGYGSSTGSADTGYERGLDETGS